MESSLVPGTSRKYRICRMLGGYTEKTSFFHFLSLSSQAFILQDPKQLFTLGVET